MDRSYLSQAEVIQNARNFVCIRLCTYESASEAAVLRRIFVGRSGQVENTTFALLSPDGNEPLVQPGRGPEWAFKNASHMAAVMADIARYYHAAAATTGPLPIVPTFRLALDVAACDDLPLIVNCGPSTTALAELAWSPDLRGRAIYTAARPEGAPTTGYLVVTPDEFGLNYRVLAQLPEKATAAQLKQALQLYQPYRKNTHDHMFRGHQQGVHWETAIPVTDPGGASHR